MVGYWRHFKKQSAKKNDKCWVVNTITRQPCNVYGGQSVSRALAEEREGVPPPHIFLPSSGRHPGTGVLGHQFVGVSGPGVARCLSLVSEGAWRKPSGRGYLPAPSPYLSNCVALNDSYGCLALNKPLHFVIFNFWKLRRWLGVHDTTGGVFHSVTSLTSRTSWYASRDPWPLADPHNTRARRGSQASHSSSLVWPRQRSSRLILRAYNLR